MTKPTYNHQEIEKKHQAAWRKSGLYTTDLKNAKKPYYNLMMYPYPSAEGLHVGNMYAFTGSDIWGRFMRMSGHDVFEPIGVDSGGIHSENFAIKMGVHPKKMVTRNVKNFKKQLAKIGNMYDWSAFVDAMDPDYYKWTQWVFIQLYRAGLAEKKDSLVTWCSSCKTTVSDEQTEIMGDKTVCERCKTEVEKRQMKQWFFKITKYADRLLNNVKKLDWSDKVRVAQRNWIGRSEGIDIVYEILDCREKITCFTTRPDTNFGATFIVLAPEHKLVDKITIKQHKGKVDNYVQQALSKSETDRIAEGREKTGVFTGVYAINNLNRKKLPIWVSDFVLGHVGTGAVVGVPGHDKRDFEFAQKYDIEVVRVVVASDGDQSAITKLEQVQEDEGHMVNSEFLDGMDIHKATIKMMDYLEEKGWGKRKQFWRRGGCFFSRQLYWGPQLPMGKGQKCCWQPVPEKDLPVLLPDIDDYLPDGSGKAPLARHPEFYKTKCPKCKSEARRETDVSDTFLDSSWYFLRYPSVGKKDVPFDSKITKKWLPVDKYIGGAEHSVLHLMYSRFITMALHDMGHLDFSTKGGLADEPFTSFYAHGLIIKDGAKMSKSRGNVVNPDEYIAKYGADALRCYLMFIGPLNQGGDFRDTGMRGMSRFLQRVWKLAASFDASRVVQDDEKTLLFHRHKTIKRVTQGIKRYKYNTSLAAIMEFTNFLETQKKVSVDDIKTLLLLLAPFAPHMAEELWQKITSYKLQVTSYKKESSIHTQSWPKWEEKYLTQDEVEIVIQVNGKKRDSFMVDAQKTDDKEFIIRSAKQSVRIQPYIKGKKIKNAIYVQSKLINFVV
jgi:leucyl-tRNA synthetase